MPPTNYRTLSISKHAHERLQHVQDDLKRRGYENVPASLRKGIDQDGATISFVIETALNALEAAMKAPKGG